MPIPDKIRVAFVSSHPPGKRTLNEYGYYMMNHFRSKTNDYRDVVLIADELPDGLKYDFESGAVGVQVETVWDFNRWRNPFTIWNAIRKSKPDVVLYNIQFLSFGDQKIPAALGLLTPLITRLSGYPSVVLLHNILEKVDLSEAGITENKFMASIYNFIGSMLSRIILSADLVAVTIPKYVETLEAKYKATNVALIPHGSFELPPLPSFEVKAGPRKIMTFGKFGTYKKVEMMIEAVELVRSRIAIPLEIVIAGTDSPNRVGYLDDVKKQYAHVPDITFTGYVEEEDVPVIFGDSTVVVFPYTSTTGSSGVLHQAGSYGKAVILPNIGDLGILVEEEGYAGAFFEPEDLESLATAIQKVVEDDDYRKSLATKNYFAAASLPMEDIVDWYTLHFRHLLSGKKY